jgi:hypothetical protein
MLSPESLGRLYTNLGLSCRFLLILLSVVLILFWVVRRMGVAGLPTCFCRPLQGSFGA